mmetsp:Transcript_26280/g.61290  ORF Transcript_26280/g.61290 Transcript_26280/m.61290 type:complete len:222 (+) Transcript_26280:543-1208(+)
MGAIRLRDPLDDGMFRGRVRRETVDCDNHLYTMPPHVVDVRDEVRAATLHKARVLLGVLLAQRLTSDHRGSGAAVQLQRTDGADDHCAAGLEAAVIALDVEELFSAHVGAEASLREHVAVLAHELQPDLVRDDRGVAVRNVRKRAGVDQRRCALNGLERVRGQCVHHEHCERASDAKVVRCQWNSLFGVAADHPAQSPTEILEVSSKCENGHDFRAHGNGE